MLENLLIKAAWLQKRSWKRNQLVAHLFTSRGFESSNRLRLEKFKEYALSVDLRVSPVGYPIQIFQSKFQTLKSINPFKKQEAEIQP